MPTNEIFTETIAKIVKQIDELKTQIGNLNTKCDMAYNASGSVADALNKKMDAMQEQVNNISNTRSETTTTPPTADGTGLPAFVVLDTKPEVEYKNYVYIYPRE